MDDRRKESAPQGTVWRHERPTIGLIISDMSTSNHKADLLGVVDGARAHDLNLLCFSGGPLHRAGAPLIQGNVLYDLIDGDRIDGLIIWSETMEVHVGREAMGSFCRRYLPLPMVSVGTAFDGIPSIYADNCGGMQEAVAHLIEVHGYRRIGFVRGPESHAGASERHRGYTEAMTKHGLAIDSDLLLSTTSGWSLDAESAVNLLLDQRSLRPQVDLEAVVVSNDSAALGLCRAFEERGIDVPEQVAVTGCDDTEQARVAMVPLTTVKPPFYELGRRAVELVVAQMQGEPVPEQEAMPSRLVVRRSCGCLPSLVVQAADRAAARLGPRQPATRDQPTVGQGASTLTVHRERIHLAMTEAAKTATEELAPKWEERLLDAFVSELGGGPPGTFVVALETALRQAVALESNVAEWQRVVSALRHHVLIDLPYGETRSRAEDLVGQARTVIGETSQQVRAHQAWRADQQAQTLSEISQMLASTFDTGALMDILAQELPRLGITCCYLSLYDRPLPPPNEDAQMPTQEARLVLAYDRQGRIELEASGQRFPSRHLVPYGLMPRARQYSMVAKALYFQDRQIGFVLFGEQIQADDVYEALRGQISTALEGAELFMRNVTLYSQALEAQQVAEEGQRLAEEANRLKSRFLSTVSHELRTPLNLIVGLSEVLLQRRTQAGTSVPPPIKADLERIHVAAQHLDGLIRDVLDLAHSQGAKLKLVREPVDLDQLLRAVAGIGEQMARDKGLEWRTEIPSSRESRPMPRVWADRTRLRQVVLNLVNNAVRFTAQGEVVLGLIPGEKEVTVTVRDTGLGIPVHEQEAIFDEFRQSERTAARGYGGLGLGLAICRRLVELHGGEIGVRSSGKEDEGSTFYFTIPVIDDQVPIRGEARSQAVVLLAEQAGSAERLQGYLVRKGFEVEVLYMDEAVDWLSDILASPPAAVVLDAKPAQEHGWETLKALKESPATQDIPVLFYSLLDDQESGSTLALDYLTKPVGTTALLRALRRQGVHCEGKAKGTGQTILVADDEPAALEMHARAVEAQFPDCRVLMARHGREALTLVQRERPDLVLLDLMMPEMDGFQVLAAMREAEPTRDTPVIVLTGQVLTESDMERLNRGVSAVLSKGVFGAEEVLAQLEAALGRDKSLAQETQQAVRKAMAYMHECYPRSISRQELAQHVGLSERHLTHCFREETGVTPIAYLNRYRVQQARRLLETTDKTIAQVATACGFSDSSYFARVFRREVGVSPRAYRRGEPPTESAPAS